MHCTIFFFFFCVNVGPMCLVIVFVPGTFELVFVVPILIAFLLVLFWKGSVRSVAFFMLDKVPAPELIAAAVENCILPYAKEHELPFDELLLQYIKVELNHSQVCR